jgi:hypothetical protein
MLFLENCIFCSTWKCPEIVQYIHSSLWKESYLWCTLPDLLFCGLRPHVP